MPGLPRKYAKMGFKKGWREYRKSKRGRSKSNPSSKSSGGSRPMGRKRSSFLNTSTIMKLVRIAALAAPAASVALSGGDAQTKLTRGIHYYTGFNLASGQWDWQTLTKGWLPYVATAAITYGIQKLSGMIRRL